MTGRYVPISSVLGLLIIHILWAPVIPRDPISCYGTTWRVPSRCATIQAGIDSATAGDTVLVACGMYDEYGLQMKSAVCLQSETEDADCVTIDGRESGRVMLCDGVENSTRIVGITFTGGFAGSGPSLGGGVYCREGSPEFVRCAFRGNGASRGGGCCCEGGFPSFIGCVFKENSGEGSVETRGAGLGTWNSSVTLLNCAFVHNGGLGGESVLGGAIYSDFGSFAVSGCMFADNAATWGGAVACFGTTATLTGCTFVDNYALDLEGSGSGGAMYLHRGATGGITNCTFFRNSAPSGSGIRCVSNSTVVVENTIIASGTQGEAVALGSSGSVLACSNLFDNEGGDWSAGLADQVGQNGNLSEDPQFCDPGNRDLRLCCRSPCAADNHPEGLLCGTIGAWEVACGVYGTRERTWSSVKALYR